MNQGFEPLTRPKENVNVTEAMTPIIEKAKAIVPKRWHIRNGSISNLWGRASALRGIYESLMVSIVEREREVSEPLKGTRSRCEKYHVRSRHLPDTPLPCAATSP